MAYKFFRCSFEFVFELIDERTDERIFTVGDDEGNLCRVCVRHPLHYVQVFLKFDILLGLMCKSFGHPTFIRLLWKNYDD